MKKLREIFFGSSAAAREEKSKIKTFSDLLSRVAKSTAADYSSNDLRKVRDALDPQGSKIAQLYLSGKHSSEDGLNLVQRRARLSGAQQKVTQFLTEFRSTVVYPGAKSQNSEVRKTASVNRGLDYNNYIELDEIQDPRDIAAERAAQQSQKAPATGYLNPQPVGYLLLSEIEDVEDIDIQLPGEEVKNRPNRKSPTSFPKAS